MDTELEKIFGELLESDKYEQVERAIFDLVRAAYMTGYAAKENAGSSEPPYGTDDKAVLCLFPKT